MPRLLKEISGPDRIVSTSAMFMALSHALKLLAYGVIGFKFSPYSTLLVYMVGGALIGSLVGVQMRKFINNQWFNHVVSILLTILALRMIYTTLI